MEDILYLGNIIYKERKILFGIKRIDRRRHVYIIGKTGIGKTTLLLNMMIQDIKNGEGLAFFDPHGDAVNKLLYYIPKERIEDVIYLNPADLDHPFAFNPLENVDFYQRHLITSSLLSVFKKIWVDAWSARMEYILTNAILALLEYPGTTLLDINKLLSDDSFRKKVINHLKDPVVKAFFEKEFEKYHQQFRVEAIAPIQNKVGQFITNPLIRNIVGQTKSSFDLREIMDRKKILLVNLSVGSIGEENSRLLGGFLISKLYLSAMSRVDIPEEERVDFYLYVDEFQNFANESFANILSEARKYRLNLILAHQYLDQIDEYLKKAVFGNVGTYIVFRVGSQDAEVFFEELEVEPDFLINTPSYYAYVKMIVDGKPQPTILAQTFPLPPLPQVNYLMEIITLNHLKYTQKREIIEARIKNIFSNRLGSGYVFCRICGNKFFSDDLEICDNCQMKAVSKISLKESIEKNLTIKLKEDKKESKVDLDEILKKLENEGQ